MRSLSQSVSGVGVGAWMPVDRYLVPPNLGYGVRVVGNLTYNVEYTYEPVFVGVTGPVFLAQSAQTTSKDGGITQPISAIRLNVTAALLAPNFTVLTTSAAGGTLAAATYFYVVSALNAAGESIASNERSILTTGATSSNTLTWLAVAGATGYRVYRGTAAGGENVFYAPGNVLTFTDTNAASTGGTPQPNTGVPTATLDVLQGAKG